MSAKCQRLIDDGVLRDGVAGTTSRRGREAPVGVSVGWRVAADLAVLDDLRVVGEVPLEPFVFGQRLLQSFVQAERSRGGVGLHQHRRCCLLGG